MQRFRLPGSKQGTAGCFRGAPALWCSALFCSVLLCSVCSVLAVRRGGGGAEIRLVAEIERGPSSSQPVWVESIRYPVPADSRPTPGMTLSLWTGWGAGGHLYGPGQRASWLRLVFGVYLLGPTKWGIQGVLNVEKGPRRADAPIMQTPAPSAP